MTTHHLVGPPTITVYVCRDCDVWTIHRRKQCVWCNSKNAPEIIQYTSEGARQ